MVSKIDNYTIYFDGNRELELGVLAKQLQTDLSGQIDQIYKRIQNSQFQPQQTQVLLQSAQNILRRSIQEIQLEKEGPFFENNGQCLGVSEWLIALFLNFKKKYPEVPTRPLLVEIAKEFKEGVGIQGAYLQKTHYLDDEKHQKILDSLQLVFEKKLEWRMDHPNLYIEILQKAYELENGIYLLSFLGHKSETAEESIRGHATVILIENNNYYFFDPNIGLAGTGREVGTEDKANDLNFILAMCQQYSPFNRADVLFQKGVRNLAQILEPEEAKLVQNLALQFRGEMACLGGPTVYGIIRAFREVMNRVFSEGEEEEIVLSLCVRPGTLQIMLELFGKVRLMKCILNYT